MKQSRAVFCFLILATLVVAPLLADTVELGPNKDNTIFTEGDLNRFEDRLLLATGAGKGKAVATAVEGPFSVDCTASLLQDHPDCTFIVDREAASQLKSA